MKFLVLGCNGMAGHLISTYLQEQGHEVVGFARSPSLYVNTIVGDATDLCSVKSAVESQKYDTIINCIGVLNQFAENNKSRAVFLNSYLPHYLVDITKGTDSQIIQMSTDCVFSGNRGQYTEDDLKDGSTFYDRTKALGEIDDDKNITLRDSIVGPDINANGIGLFNWFMKQKDSVDGYTKVIWTGLTTLELAKVMESAALNRSSGLYNIVPDESISKCDLLRLFNKYFRNNEITINPVNKISSDKSLIRVRRGFDYRVPDYESMVAELAKWVGDHRTMYPHYTYS